MFEERPEGALVLKIGRYDREQADRRGGIRRGVS